MENLQHGNQPAGGDLPAAPAVFFLGDPQRRIETTEVRLADDCGCRPVKFGYWVLLQCFRQSREMLLAFLYVASP